MSGRMPVCWLCACSVGSLSRHVANVNQVEQMARAAEPCGEGRAAHRPLAAILPSRARPQRAHAARHPALLRHLQLRPRLCAGKL